MSVPPHDDPVVSAVVAPLCVCDEPMRGEPITAGRWRFVCPFCEAVVYVVHAPPLQAQPEKAEWRELSPPPAEPTGHPAGSEDKLAVMAERWRRGESLFHAQDNPECGAPPPASAGVTWDEKRQRWHVRVSVPGVGRVMVGTFGDEPTARRAAELARAGRLAEAAALAGGEGRSARRRGAD